MAKKAKKAVLKNEDGEKMKLKRQSAPLIVYTTPRKKPLAELTGADIPPGVDPYECAIDHPLR